MSEAIAGVTLLSLANGAGDVVTAIVAGGTENGVSYTLVLYLEQDFLFAQWL